MKVTAVSILSGPAVSTGVVENRSQRLAGELVNGTLRLFASIFGLYLFGKQWDPPNWTTESAESECFAEGSTATQGFEAYSCFYRLHM